jgi:hypothetical protein
MVMEVNRPGFGMVIFGSSTDMLTSTVGLGVR